MQNKTFRLFISSTFSDFKKERDVLHTQVFPEIESYCQDNGFVFQPIDLRWGVSNEAQLDQKTLELCLEEVRVCKHFPHPNFLIMTGDRYGYIPLPYMIEKKEFEKIRNLVMIVDDLELLNFWYKLDENQLPASYILQPRKDHTQNSNVNDKFKKDFVTLNAPVNEEKKEFNAAWSEHENRLRTILQNGANEIFKDKNDKEYQKYFLSATEREVVEGIYDYHNLTFHKVDVKYIFGYFKGQEADIKGEDALKFKANLKSILTPENFVEDIKSLTKKLKDAIYDQITTFEKMTELDKELSEQLNFRNTKVENFIGREITLNNIIAYTQNPKTTIPLIIHGASGMGKSSLVAKAISEAKDKNLFYRFVGATANSTTIRSILISLCKELEENGIIEKITEYEVEENKFYAQINEKLSSISKHIVVFIDALDQLTSKDNLEWLPVKLPNSLKIVLSVLNDEKYAEDTHYYNILKIKYPQAQYVNIEEDSLELFKESLIDTLLKAENRQIDSVQKKHLLKQWGKTNYSPLYLKIAIEEVKHWRAGDKGQKLADGVEGIIKEYIENLSRIYHHDKIVVEKVFGYINSSKDGLSEKELLDILSEDLEDEEEFQNAIKNEWHTLIKKQNPRRDNKEELVLPLSIWSRLHSHIKPFIVERNIDNQPLMKFFHRQFTTVVDEYIKEYKIKLHKKLVAYFDSLDTSIRKVKELFYHAYLVSNINVLFKTIQNTELFIIYFDSLESDDELVHYGRAAVKFLYDSQDFNDPFHEDLVMTKLGELLSSIDSKYYEEYLGFYFNIFNMSMAINRIKNFITNLDDVYKTPEVLKLLCTICLLEGTFEDAEKYILKAFEIKSISMRDFDPYLQRNLDTENYFIPCQEHFGFMKYAMDIGKLYRELLKQKNAIHFYNKSMAYYNFAYQFFNVTDNTKSKEYATLLNNMALLEKYKWKYASDDSTINNVFVYYEKSIEVYKNTHLHNSNPAAIVYYNYASFLVEYMELTDMDQTTYDFIKNLYDDAVNVLDNEIPKDENFLNLVFKDREKFVRKYT